MLALHALQFYVFNFISVIILSELNTELIIAYRSEYCRNVKLKYCLESTADWAQEFRERLAKPYNKGGFSGRYYNIEDVAHHLVLAR